jgi:phosphoribosyl 1,2-cyclic phosphodiesterase
MAKLTFLGTGGGRFAVIRQVRASGGWVLDMDGELLHIDPGPGTLVRAKQFHINLSKLTGVLVSHCHPDHYTDLEMVVEAMTCGGTRKRGVLLSNQNVIRGSGNYNKVISDYHLKKLQRYEIMKPGDTATIGTVTIAAVKATHSEPQTLGFVFSGSKRIGATSDGEYYPGQENCFKGCDLLIVNCLRTRHDPWPKHMNARMAQELIKKAQPKRALLKDFGMKMLKEAAAEKEAAWIAHTTGVPTDAATDGMVISL